MVVYYRPNIKYVTMLIINYYFMILFYVIKITLFSLYLCRSAGSLIISRLHVAVTVFMVDAESSSQDDDKTNGIQSHLLYRRF